MESGERDRIVSLSKNGFIALWDGKDGMRLKTVNNLGNGMHYGIKLQVWSLSLVSFIERKVLLLLISSLISLAVSLTHGSPQPLLVPLLTQLSVIIFLGIPNHCNHYMLNGTWPQIVKLKPANQQNSPNHSLQYYQPYMYMYNVLYPLFQPSISLILSII
ncbi:PREDICTED: uncharacterized protein LOC109589454 [Amphimedon queenslandica]|uniref:Uncharacterized protein n=1 Tax=Amphimedon queenslandica TaxID=400682 RepID=A0AAN0JW21_AMPQE|nr:PREDICTED: uncharacterized protein LOC109589454 [Amphimedon queenslandica]|eukprot:XP_019861100.1 PREDICTED: uncharacterized protein LOC109589454 [Amphimedon queenslandica]